MHVDIRFPCIRLVADVAFLSGNEVSVILTGCERAIVAGRARTKHLCMINPVNRYPRSHVVAILTYVRRRYVIQVFSGCVGTVMATDTVARDIDVVKRRRSEAICCMAIIAIVTADNMVWRFADRNRVVMTGCTAADHLRVIDRHGRLKDRGTVAILANIGNQNVVLLLADRIRSIVTANAIASDGCVIENRGHERLSRMAIIAVIATRNMVRVFADGNCAVMAG